MNKRLFLLVGDTLTLFEFQEKQLIGSHTFLFNEAGFESFRKTLQSLPVCPAQLMVSMPNEDFYREKVPHVRHSERSIVVKRFIKKHFRDEKYTHVLFQERDAEGRKDDNVLISSIGASIEFDQWLSLIHELKLPLVGIWSVPLFFNELLKDEIKKDRTIIFLNREMNGYYRQTLFVNGSMILSRVTDNINNDDGVNKKIKSLNDFTEQLYKFSTNKRIVNFDSKVKVICAFDDIPIPDLANICSVNNIQYEHIDLGRETFEFKLAKICLQHIHKSPHYINVNDSHAYTVLKKNKKIYKFLAFMSFLMLSSSGAIAIKSFDIYQQGQYYYESAINLEHAYGERYGNVEPYLDFAIDLDSLVNEIDQKQLNAGQMPMDMFPGLSEVLSKPRFSELETNHILWKRYDGLELEAINRVFPQKEAEEEVFDPNESFEDVAEQEKIFINIIGTYVVDDISYDKAINTMNRFEYELAQIEGVKSVYMLRIPIDLRVDSSFKDYQGILISDQNLQSDPSTYEFILEYSHE